MGNTKTQPTDRARTTLFISLFFLIITLPIYFSVNLIQNRSFVALSAIAISLIIFSLSLLTKNLRQLLIATVIYLIFLIAFQFSAVGFFFVGYEVNNFSVRNVLALKSLLVFGIAFVFVAIGLLNRIFFIHKKKSPLYPFDKALLLFLFFILASFVLSPAALEPKLAYLIHSIGSFCLVYLLFRLHNFRADHLKLFGKIIIPFCLVLSLIGIIMYPFQDEVWRDYLRIDVAYASMGGITSWPPPWFNTAIVLGQKGIGLKRLVSVVGNPITFGYLTVFGYVMALYLKKTWLLIPLACAIALILSKGALLLFLIINLFYFLRIKKFGTILLADIFLAALTIVYSLTTQQGPRLRLQAVILPLQFLFSNFGFNALFGYGLGSGGTLAAQGGYLTDNVNAEDTGGESALGTILYQLGFVGGLLFILFFLFYQFEISKRIRSSSSDTSLYRLALGVSTGFMIISIYQESIIVLTLFVPYLMMLAIAANHHEKIRP